MEPIRNGIVIGIANAVAIDPHYYGSKDPYFFSVFKESECSLACLMTPPFPLLITSLSRWGEKEIAALVKYLGEGKISVLGVNGPLEVAEAFSRCWCENMNTESELVIRSRLHALTEVKIQKVQDGELRRATVDDCRLVTEWAVAFSKEADTVSLEGIEERVKKQVEKGEFFLFEVERRAVSMATKTRAQNDMVSISYVFTRPEERGKGYGTATVARLSERLLDSGYPTCTLFTDLANPTSNSIYKKIGYEPVQDFARYEFRG